MAKILLVEDDPVLTEMYQDKFTHAKYEIHTARDGRDAFETLQNYMPDVMLVDLIMPNMSGFDFIKLIKHDDKFKDIPVFVLTNIYPDTLDLLKNYGVEEVVLKSNTTPEQLLEKIQILLSSRQNSSDN